MKGCPRCRRLSKALDAATDVGIYAKAVVGRYKKRTPYMNGWNAHSRAVIKAVIKVLEKYPEKWM